MLPVRRTMALREDGACGSEMHAHKGEPGARGGRGVARDLEKWTMEGREGAVVIEKYLPRDLFETAGMVGTLHAT